MNLRKKIFERHNIKGKVEIFSAKDLDEIRDRVHERKKAKFENYKVSGDTYPNRHTLRSYGLEWDAKEKAYRGKLSPEDINKMKKISGLNITKDTKYYLIYHAFL
ncbi:unnamed protein product [marine sediment metagenome]|uniref:Uncharacterized protein n=1 Tax=marine sediment metagenome TaxID=412755 RepID=X1HF78_9ZZZZ